MTTRTLLTHALWAATLAFPTALAHAQPRPAPTPNPAPAPAPGPRPGPTPNPRPTPNAERQAPEHLPLTIGEANVNAINRDDYQHTDGKYYDYYRVELDGSTAYHFSVSGHSYDATVNILYEDGSPTNDLKVSSNDNSMVVIYTPRQPGVYLIAVTTENADDSGRYILHSQVGDERLPERENQSGQVAVPEGTRPFRGELNNQSGQSAQGRYFDFSVLELEAGKTYCLYVQSPDDAVYMDIESIDGHPVEFLAIEQEGAYIEVTPTVTGQHAIVTCTKEPGHATSYTGYAWVPSTGSSETIVDQLTAQSTLLDNGCYFDYHEVDLVAGTTYVIDVTSDDFDAIAYLFDADYNQLAENDNGQGTGTNAQITFTPEQSGTYSVGISTKQPGATGGYMARVASGDRIGRDPGVRVTRGQDGPANNAGGIVGRWEVTTFELGGTTDQVPAGALELEFTADGIGRSYMGGRLQDEGTYRIEGDQITMVSHNDDNPDDTLTFRVQGDTLTLTGELEPGKVGTMTLRRVAGERNTPANDAAARLVGHWDMIHVVQNGQEQEVAVGTVAYAFKDDGTLTFYQDGRVADNGTYTIDGDQITLTDSSGQPETSTFAINGDRLTVTIEPQPGQTVVITLQRGDAQRPDPDPQPAIDPAILGRWEFTNVNANGQDNPIPAGSMTFEFLDNGRFRMHQNGQVAGEGTYATEDGALLITVDGEQDTERNTYRIQGNEMTLGTVIPPNTPATVTLRKMQ